ncbi:DUF2752 domain-containing protein [Xanthomonas campestris pv. badrii]|uniref:DUF2752 domain-containing protein n=1 Tax=Xanthomonas campestris pv. badrii TaxID=149696 RepID=A0A7Z2V7F5_XANCA|nr:DUF2752 domain-containing protein [Xanthomonas campestris]MCC4605791.1 DUF2752 domain-containing protein [Xanthomonas campestris pv. parthenii]QJD66384.1 DUF2752 domain-containing protein [Xanthomonas campestris pv. badrii]
MSKRLLYLSLAPAAVAAGAGTWIFWKFDPNLPGNPFPPCAFHALTGFYCPGCGITRALHALVHGDLVSAFGMNALAVGLLALVPFVVLWHHGWQPAIFQPIARALSSPLLWITLLPGFWIARNLPWLPFTLLAPG